MKTYKIEITEILQRVISVEADSEDDAIDQVTKEYRHEDIVLDASDSIGSEINVYDDRQIE